MSKCIPVYLWSYCCVFVLLSFKDEDTLSAHFITIVDHTTQLMISTKRCITQLTVLLHNNCDRICEKGSYSLSNWTHLTVRCVTCEYGTNLKFGHFTLLTWFYSWEQFYMNRVNTLWAVINWSWKLRKAIRPLFADPVTIIVII